MGELFFRFANLCGLLSFSTEGAIEGKQYSSGIGTMLCAVTTAFGGGIVFRDVLLLHIFPTALSDGSEVLASICLALLIQHISITSRKRYVQITSSRSFRVMLTLMDDCGSGMYICAGISKAISHGLIGLPCILSGVVSTIGGGFLTALLCGARLREAITKNLAYKLIVIYNAFQHYLLIQSGLPVADAQVFTILHVILLYELKQFTMSAITYLSTGKQYKTSIIINVKKAYFILLVMLILGYKKNRSYRLTDGYAKLTVCAKMKCSEARVIKKRGFHMMVLD